MIYSNIIRRTALQNCVLSEHMDTNKMRHVHSVMMTDILDNNEGELIRIAAEVMSSLRLQGCFKDDFATEYRVYTNIITVLYVYLSREIYNIFIRHREDLRNMFAVPYSQLWNAIV